MRDLKRVSFGAVDEWCGDQTVTIYVGHQPAGDMKRCEGESFWFVTVREDGGVGAEILRLAGLHAAEIDKGSLYEAMCVVEERAHVAQQPLG